MTSNDEKCLAALNDFSRGEYCIPFQPIMDVTGLDRREVRLSIRRLARQGFAEYHKGLWDESTGDPAGAGYLITEKGQAILSKGVK